MIVSTNCSIADELEIKKYPLYGDVEKIHFKDTHTREKFDGNFDLGTGEGITLYAVKLGFYSHTYDRIFYPGELIANFFTESSNYVVVIDCINEKVIFRSGVCAERATKMLEILTAMDRTAFMNKLLV